jgi:hypothetical protein
MSTGVPQVEAGKNNYDNKSDSANDQHGSFTRPAVARDDLLASTHLQALRVSGTCSTFDAVPIVGRLISDANSVRFPTLIWRRRCSSTLMEPGTFDSVL